MVDLAVMALRPLPHSEPFQQLRCLFMLVDRAHQVMVLLVDTTVEEQQALVTVMRVPEVEPRTLEQALHQPIALLLPVVVEVEMAMVAAAEAGRGAAASPLGRVRTWRRMRRTS